MSQSNNHDKRLNKRLKDMPIAIVGMASIFANSRYLNKFWDLISEKIDAIVDIPDSHWNADDYYDPDKSAPDKSYCKRGGFLPEVDFNPMEFGLPPNILELTDTSQLLSLVVAKEVLADAGIDAQYDTDRIGITLGVGGGQKINHSLSSRLQYPVLKKVFKNSGISDADSEMLIKKFQDQYIHWEENSFPGSLGNVIAGRIANRFDLGGMNCVVDAACAGSLAAMRMAITELVEGRSDMMITGGVCTDNSPSMYMSFSKTPAFTTNDTIQPFDIDSKGMMIGEGIGMIAIKRLEDAERDGDKIYAVIKGIGSSSDGKFKSIYAPRPEGQAKALKRAYDDAGFAPHTVGLIEAHGTGTAAGDVAEFNGLTSVFAEDNQTKQHIALGSVKSQVGHTKSTAGTAGLIKVALALHHKVLPPTINVSKPHPKLGINDSPFYLNTETRPWLPRPDDTPRRAGISSFGFGGTNFHIVLEEYRQEHARNDKYRQRAVPQSLLISADNKAALQSKLAELQAEIAAIDTSKANSQELALTELAQRFVISEIAPTAARLGLVVTSIADLTVQLTQALGQLTNNDANNWQLPSGASYRSASLVHKNAKAKVAALFAGQGAQYVNMATELACYYPEMRQQLMQADKVFAKHKQTPLSQIIYPIPAFEAQDIAAQQAALTNTAYAQSAIGAVSMGQYALFTQAGFSPDMIAGHSFGELSALCAAGVISQDDYYQLAFARGQAMAATPADQDPGAMYAIIVPPQAAEQGVSQLENCISTFNGVKVANYNAPTQLVIAGPTEACADAAKAITAELGFKAIALPVSGAFHTPLVGHAQKPFAKAISKVKFAKPNVALYANGTGKLHPSDGKAIQAAFSEHMLQSVRFSEQLVAMYDAGARIFVEFGPKNILQKLVEATLSNKPEAVSVVSLNPNPKGSSDTQLRQAATQLAVLGVALTEVDPYQAPLAELAKVSPMNVKLTAQNYISPSTQAKMQTSLQSGEVTSKTVEVPVEKIVEKIVEKQVIKTEYVEVATAPTASAQASQTSAQAQTHTKVSNDSLSAFFAAQQQTATLHQQFLAIPQQYGDTFNSLMTAQAQMASSGVAIPESLQRSMELFHQHQAQTLQSHTQFLALQGQTSQAALAMLQGQAPAPVNTFANNLAALQAVTAPVAATQTPVMTQAAATTPAPTPAAVSEPIAQEAQPAAPMPATAPVASASKGLSADAVQLTMMNVVADKTGYPTEMLELSMDMEADLGIDSIKRVEILGTVQGELPGLPELSPEDLAECRTLGEIVDYMQSKLAPVQGSTVQTSPAKASVAQTSAPTSGLSAETVLTTMMTVVADKTGYPAEMLELTMDMEADLGIDSIKRVEILGTVQDELPGLPELSPEDLAECRTLGEIVDYMQSKLAPVQGSTVPAPVAASTQAITVQTSPAQASGLSAETVLTTMMAVVADKTGYPAEMLELTMDMEADLGIDSIKRVEILGTVQDELPGLPELNPEDLAECRTLGEIVDYMQSKLAPVQGSTVQTSSAKASVAQTSAPTSNLSAETVLNTMMTVVADKTGYPAEMLELTMDMEADLGIDSIKRVEILGTVQDELPGLPELSPEDLAECRTLGEIVDYMQSKLAPVQGSTIQISPAKASVAQTSAPTSNLSAETVLNTMMSVVADKTGYPAEMLELTMDMEADLGIDSIKRVEILGTVQDELPGLPELNPEDLAECRTLGEIVSYMQGKLGAPASATVTAKSSTEVIDTSDLPPHIGVALKKLPAADKLEACYSTDSCIIITDDGHNAGVLAEKLHAKGLTVAVIRNPDSISAAHSPLSSDISSYVLNSIDDASIAKVVSEISAKHPIAGFVHLQPQFKLNTQNLVSCNEAAKSAVDNAFLWAKHLHAEFAKPLQSRLSYFTVSRIDGGFGYLDSAALSKAELNQAALSGLTKTLSHEWPNVFCRALDIANNIDAKTFANAIIAELFDVNGEAPSAKRITEVGISQQGRATLIAAKTGSSQYPEAVLTQQDNILVTGGAKGVTFECALTLAKQCQSHFVLAGRSQHLGNNMPAWAQGKQASELKTAAISYIQSQGEKPTPKQIDALVWPVQSSLEIDRALAAFTKVGASAQYVAMDVSNAKGVIDALAALTDANDKKLVINGVIHGAGVLADKHIQDKTLDELNRVYSTKVTGITSIINALDPQEIKLVAMFSSAAGFYGNTGQSDYAMSNEILNKTALKLASQLPQAKVMSFNWGPWDGGMVSSALKKMFVERGVYVIPLEAGANLFAHSLLSSQGVQMLIGSDMQGSASQDATAKKPNANTLPHAEGSLTFSAPYLATDSKIITVTRVLQRSELEFVNDHRIAGNPVLPTVCAMQWMRETAQTLCHIPVSIADYKLLKGVIFDTDQPHLLQLQLTQTDAGISALIMSRLLNEPNSAMKPQYQATLVANDALTDSAITASRLPATVLQNLSQMTAIHQGNSLYQNGTLFHGPRLQGIKQVLSFDDEQLLCQVKLPLIELADCPGFAPSSVAGGSQLFAEDLLLQAMLVWARLKYDAASLPSSMGQFITVAPFVSGDKGYIQLEVLKHSGRMLMANVSLYHQDGRLSCQMRDAKITISKTLNQAFINQHEDQPANQHSKDSV
ncbi:KR domain-containing protein [Shewanella inventionis]|uniref:type I polyketide synthase n=1 Tax=Shewanella inventionis TaxID=1738770 RepID=UPI001CBEB37A|nr:type I polyketide synthase [Shewanella inventionis]UAL44973.1 KR domain-containing protein [Shewanella inventionis]